MEPAIWTAIAAGGPAVIVIALLLVYGVPKWLDLKTADQKREAEIQKVATELATVGPTMVIAELRLMVQKLETRCEKLEIKNDTLEMQHRECQHETASLREAKEKLENRIAEQDTTIVALKSQNVEQAKELGELKSQVEELKKQQGIWRAIQATETKARIEGDAAKQ